MPFTPHPDNPILTQRDLPEDRAEPITSVGHADFTQDSEGNWWAVFLGTRPYQGNEYNTGRETFLMPVSWDNGIPRITKPGDVIPHVIDRPALPAQPKASLPLTGNFTYTDEFEEDVLPLHWLTVRIPAQKAYRLENGELVLEARADGVGSPGQPSFLARRQQHTNAEAYTEVSFVPEDSDDEAGIAAFQNDAAYYALGLSMSEDGKAIVRLRKRAGDATDKDGEIVAEVPAAAPLGASLKLRIVSRGPEIDFYQAARGDDWEPVALSEDSTILSTEKAGGFVGTLLGVYAQSAGD